MLLLGSSGSWSHFTKASDYIIDFMGNWQLVGKSFPVIGDLNKRDVVMILQVRSPHWLGSLCDRLR